MLSIQEQSNLDKMKSELLKATRQQLSYVAQATSLAERTECLELMVNHLRFRMKRIDDYVDSLY